MPRIFKTFASISVWILFIFGCFSILGGFGRVFLGNNQDSLLLIAVYFGYGILGLFLSITTALLRKKMD
jgi:hypothetical protein